MNTVENFYHKISGTVKNPSQDVIDNGADLVEKSNVSFQDLLNATAKEDAKVPAEVEKKQNTPPPLAFHDVDKNSDGRVGLEEYQAYLDTLNIDSKHKEFLTNEFQRFEMEADGQKGVTFQEYQRWIDIAKQSNESDFNYYDLNGDGMITKKEIHDLASRVKNIDMNRLAEIGKGMDTNKDGQVSLEEYRLASKTDDTPVGFHDVDTDSNGRVNLKEYQAYLDTLNLEENHKDSLMKDFQRFEMEADGQKGVTFQEYQRGTNIAKKDSDSDFNYYDLNGDGMVTDKEIYDLARRVDGIDVGRLAEIGRGMDANKDGQVSLEEYRLALNVDDGAVEKNDADQTA